MISAHEVERAVFVDADNLPNCPDMFADEAAGAEGLVIEILGNTVANCARKTGAIDECELPPTCNSKPCPTQSWFDLPYIQAAKRFATESFHQVVTVLQNQPRVGTSKINP